MKPSPVAQSELSVSDQRPEAVRADWGESGAPAFARAASAPLTWEQKQIWLHGLLYPELPLYVETFALRVAGELDATAFEASLDAFCRRYPLWRTTVREQVTGEQDGRPWQVVGELGPFSVPVFNFDEMPELERAREVATLLDEYARRPFDLGSGPLVRAFAVRSGASDTTVFLTVHHLIFDGASMRQSVLPELIGLYEDFRAGQGGAAEAKVEGLDCLDYLDYARREEAGANDRRRSSMAFWEAKLAGFAPLSLPVDWVRTEQTSRRGGVRGFRLSAELGEAITALARRERTTAFSILLASFVVLLARSSETEDVTVGTVYGGRGRTELEQVVGCFLNILLLRTGLEGSPSFRELLRRVREVTLDAVEHADAPFQEVVREALPRTGAGAGDSPVQAVFAFQPPAVRLPAGWDVDVFEVFNGCAKFDLHLEVEQKDGTFAGRLIYNSELFEAATAEALVGQWVNLIEDAVAAPERCVWEMKLLGVDEERRLLDGVNRSAMEVPGVGVHELFVRQAMETPGRVAVCCGGRSVTYRELEEQSARIAGRLLELGFGAGCVVGLMVERSVEMVAGLLGILRAGAAYVPLDPGYPSARLGHMVRASGMRVVLGERRFEERLPVGHPPLVDVGELYSNFLSDGGAGAEAITSANAALLPEVGVADSAYILFTSGSTGVPKGVEIPHRALTNLIWSMRRTPGLSAEDVLLAVTGISFDIAALELFLPLVTGARLELATSAEASDPGLLMQRLAESGATVMQATPATWRMLIEQGWRSTPGLKVLCGGEALTTVLAGQLLERAGEVWNMYGPTETTIWSACMRVEDAEAIGLGAPVANTGLYVLDGHKAIVGAGVAGELYIGGDGLAKGYVGQTELTRERFPVVRMEDGVERRLYRTGDRVKRLRDGSDGSLVFLGRMDRQVKLHGFRIELGEIEQVLNGLAGVQESIAVVGHRAGRGEFLAAYVVPKVGMTVRVEELRAGMAESLPKYMQPGVLQVLERPPLTLNGKLDRSRLPELMEDERVEESDVPRAGVEARLAAIWCELLGVKAVGRRDGFFDLGGHSLLAARFVALAGREFGRKLTFASFLQTPTIEAYAKVVMGAGTPRVQKLRDGGRRVLWIGVEPWLTRLAKDLSGDVGLWAITPGIDADAEEMGADWTIEAMAGQIVGDVRSVQAAGPYVVAGFCLRSLLAYEVARRLTAAGEEVALLVLGDVYAPGQRPEWTRVQRVIRRVHRESWNLWSVVRFGGAGRMAKLGGLVGSWVDRMRGRADDTETRDELLQALYRAEAKYAPGRFGGRVLFLESGETRLVKAGTSAGWREYVEDVQMLEYPGIHENVLSEPYLGVFAGQLQCAIDEALR